jgi:hypothetical protein
MTQQKPHRYTFKSRHDYKEGISAWIRHWKQWRAERKRTKRKKEGKATT